MTALAPAPVQAPVHAGDDIRLTFGRVLRSETIKLLTLRSTWWSIVLVAVLSVGMSALIALVVASNAGGAPHAAVPMAVLTPIQFTMLLAGALGAIAVTGEYSTGMIRSTLTAEPRRGRVLAAKAIVVATLLAVLSIVVFTVAALVAAAILQTAPIDAADPAATLQPMLYGALAMAVYALIGLSFGFVLRSGPGAIAATVGLLFILPIVAAMFPAQGSWGWLATAAHYLPMYAANSLTVAPGTDGVLSIPVALLTLGCWVAAGLGASWTVLRLRDA